MEPMKARIKIILFIAAFIAACVIVENLPF